MDSSRVGLPKPYPRAVSERVQWPIDDLTRAALRCSVIACRVSCPHSTAVPQWALRTEHNMPKKSKKSKSKRTTLKQKYKVGLSLL